MHRHILVCGDLGIRIVLLCRHPAFDWSEWADECVYNHSIPPTIRNVGLMLLASGIKLSD